MIGFFITVNKEANINLFTSFFLLQRFPDFANNCHKIFGFTILYSLHLYQIAFQFISLCFSCSLCCLYCKGWVNFSLLAGIFSSKWTINPDLRFSKKNDMSSGSFIQTIFWSAKRNPCCGLNLGWNSIC